MYILLHFRFLCNTNIVNTSLFILILKKTIAFICKKGKFFLLLWMK